MNAQLYEEGNLVAGVVCGLGGGSLANMGQMVSTPVRTKKDPRWPNDWQKDWEAHETLALTMLNPQDPPVEFASAKAVKAVAEEIEESSPTPIKQAINFNSINDPGNVKGSTQLEQCVARGNCMSGCPYNAKNSNDKNYITLAIEACVSSIHLFFCPFNLNDIHYWIDHISLHCWQTKVIRVS
ncbi:hypothetical protein AAC387_Pa05g1037 [Persea americana]